MRALLAAMFMATVLSAPAFAEEDDTQGPLRFQPGAQFSGFAMEGTRDELAWGMGLQGTLFKIGPASFGGAGISFYEVEAHWKTAPYIELVTLDMTRSRGIQGITFKWVFRNAFSRQGEPLDHGFAVGVVVAGF